MHELILFAIFAGANKKGIATRMERTLHILALLFLLFMGCPEHSLAAESGQQGVGMHAAVLHARLQSVAVPADPQSIYRVCSSRPQRVLPSFSNPRHPVNGRRLLAGKMFHSSLQRQGSRVRMETAPFQSVASCDYYVFALKHLLC